MDKVDCSFLAELLDTLESAVLLADETGVIFIRNHFAQQLLGSIGHLAELWPRLEFPHEGASDTAGESFTRGAHLADLSKFPCEVLLNGVGQTLPLRLQVMSLGGSGAMAVVGTPLACSADKWLQQRRTLDEGRKAVAKAAHEINNPLDGMGRFLNLAAKAAAKGDSEKCGQYIQRGCDGVARLKSIVSRMLDSTKTAQPAADAPQPAHLQIQQAIDVMSPAISAAAITLVCDIDMSEDALVSASLFAAACNLIKNACDAMAGGGRLSLTGKMADDHLTLDVIDTGSGVAAEIADKIFMPFYTTKPAASGTGLGLSVSRRQLQIAGGDLQLMKSAGGAHFRITLPIEKPPQSRRKLS